MNKLNILLIHVLITILFVGCNNDNDDSPNAITIEASEITESSVILNGIVNAKGLTTFIFFELGETTDYGLSITPLIEQINGNTDTNVNVVVSGLTPNTTYHFRVFATNTKGERYGADQTFTTLVRRSWLLVGETVSSISETDVVPDTTIKAGWNENIYYPIDLDNDGNADINLRSYTVYHMGGMVLADGGVKASTLNSETFIASDSIYAFAFSEGDTLRISDTWRSGEFTLEFYGNSNFPPGPYYNRGFWVEGENKYLGIRKNDHLGWIKLDTDKTSFTVYKFALQK
jgi:hypothetical protein